MYFGTEEYMMWVPTPLSGAPVSPEGWNASGTLLGGGGYAFHSWDSHKTYQFDWSGASTRQAAQVMHSFRDGSFGTGLIYFHDPLTYETNVLPKRWADPSLGVREPSASLVYDTKPTQVVTSGWEQHTLPRYGASYNVSTLPTAIADATSLFLPIPPGYMLALGAIYSAAATAGVYVTIVDNNGNNGATNRLTPLAPNTAFIASNYVSGVRGIRLWVGKTSGTTGSVVLSAMTARLFKSANTSEELPAPGFGTLPFGTYGGYRQTRAMSGPWIGGQGHSGCRFDGEPSLVNNTGVNGGQVGYSATFREVGHWSKG